MMGETMSTTAARYARYYAKGFWTKRMLWNVVGHKINEDEYELITGEPYE